MWYRLDKKLIIDICDIYQELILWYRSVHVYCIFLINQIWLCDLYDSTSYKYVFVLIKVEQLYHER